MIVSLKYYADTTESTGCFISSCNLMPVTGTLNKTFQNSVSHWQPNVPPIVETYFFYFLFPPLAFPFMKFYASVSRMKTFLLRREMFSHLNFLSGTMLTLNFAAKLSISSRIWVVAEWCRKVYFVRLALIPRDTDIRENQWIICIKWNYPLCAGKSRSGDGRAILIFICYLYKEKQQMMLARGRDLYAANKLMVSDTLTASSLILALIFRFSFTK